MNFWFEYLFSIFSIDAYPLEVEYVEDIQNLCGFRIVDIDYFLKKSITLQAHHNRKCTAGRLEIIKEKRQGLHSTFLLQCTSCNEVISISNENGKVLETSMLNRAAVWATLATGSTYSHMLEFFSILDIPSISSNMFYNLQRNLSNVSKKRKS